MKKVLSFILMLFVFPLIALADMGAPSIIYYDAEVTNPDGAIIYDYKEITKDNYGYVDTGKKIEYGTKVEVVFDSDTDKVDVEIKNDWYTISAKDITPLVKEYKVDKSKLKTHTGIILKEQEIKKGPSVGYEGTGINVKVGDNVTLYELVPNDGALVWVYIEYNGTNGYISVLKSKVAFDYFTESMITGNETKLTDINGNSSTIPANTFIRGGYYVDAWSHAYYVEYDGEKGFIDKYAVGHKFADYKVINEANVYESADINSKIVGTLKKGTIILNPYVINSYPPTRVYYNGEIKGWLIQDYDDNSKYQKDILEIIEKHYKVLKEVPIYKEKDAETKIGSIKTGEIVDLTYNCDKTLKHFICEYYTKNTGNGYIVFKGSNIDNLVSEYLERTDEEATIIPTTTTKTTTNKQDKQITKESRENFVLICVLSGIIVCLTGVVIVLLINKNKQKTDKKLQ